MPPDGSHTRLLPSLGVGRLERVLALRGFPPYDKLDAEEVSLIAAKMKERRFGVGDVLLEPGRQATSFFFVIRGGVEIRKDGRLLRALGDRSVVGGTAALAEDPLGYEVVASQPTLALELGVDDAWEDFEDHFVLGRTVIEAIAHEVIKLRQGMPQGLGYAAVDWHSDAPLPEPLDLVGRLALLRRAMTFAGSRLEALADLAREAREIRAETPFELWKTGDPSNGLVVIVHGTAECTMRRDDGTEEVFRLGPGDILGAMDSMSQTGRWYDARTEGPFVGLSLAHESFMDVLEDHFTLARSAITSLSKAMLRLLEQQAQLDESERPAPRPSARPAP